MGRFHTPQAGTYYITMMGSSSIAMPLRLELLLNGDMKAMLYIGAYQSYETVTKTRAVILRLAADDELRVRIPEGHFLYGESDPVYNSFCGFFIY